MCQVMANFSGIVPAASDRTSNGNSTTGLFEQTASAEQVLRVRRERVEQGAHDIDQLDVLKPSKVEEHGRIRSGEVHTSRSDAGIGV